MFSPKAEKYEPKTIQIRALFTQCYLFAESFKNLIQCQILGKIDYVEYLLIATA